MGFGDALLDSGAARVAQQTDPRKCRIVLGQRIIWSEVWENNPRIAQQHEQGDFQIVYGRDPVSNMRPYHSGKSPQRWTYNLAFRPQVGEIYFTDKERATVERHNPEIVIEPNIKPNASPNKQWTFGNWRTFSRLARGAGFRLFQLGPQGTTRMLEGATLITTRSFREACAILARAKAYVGHEGGLHHAAAALGIPGVVIFGGFTPVELTGYPLHRNLGASLADACGMRLPCQHCIDWSRQISPEMVLENLRGVLQ